MGELVEVAFVGSEPEAAMIQALLDDDGIRSLQQKVGPSGSMLGYGPLNPGGGSRRVMVHPHQAEAARALLADALAENENEPPEPANARYLEDAASGRRPRDYGLAGGYGRAYLVAFGAMALAFGIFMLLRVI